MGTFEADSTMILVNPRVTAILRPWYILYTPQSSTPIKLNTDMSYMKKQK